MDSLFVYPHILNYWEWQQSCNYKLHIPFEVVFIVITQ